MGDLKDSCACGTDKENTKKKINSKMLRLGPTLFGIIEGLCMS